ncbi:MAG: hypothetical protein WC183_09610 [Methanosarcina sp.]
MLKYNVCNEYDRLRLCAVGIPFDSYLVNGEWKTFFYPRLNQECVELVDILEDSAVSILNQHVVSYEEVKAFGNHASVYGCPQIFPRDSILIVCNEVYHLGGRTCILGFDMDVSMVSLRYDHTDEFSPSIPFLEGGDTILLDDIILCGLSQHSYHLSNRMGAEWLKDSCRLREVKTINMPEYYYHLDMCFSVVSNDLILCADSLILPSDFPDVEICRIPDSELSHGEINGLAISDGRYIVPAYNGNPSQTLIGILDDYGIDYSVIDFTRHMDLLGGIRCATVPFLRK